VVIRILFDGLEEYVFLESQRGYHMNTKLIRFATPLIAVALMSSAPILAHAQDSQKGSQTQTQDWNTPPAGTEQAQAYKDGIEAAQLDKAAKRPVDAHSSHLYVHPPVKGAAKDAYRNSFDAGYKAAVAHSGSQS
jgi:hypothetical protein